MSTALLKAIGIIGSRRSLAKAIGTTPDAINAWLNRGVNVPLEYAIEIERITASAVTWPEVAPHLAHFAKRWSGFFITNNSVRIQMMHVSLSRIKHECHIKTLTQDLYILSDDIKSHGLKHPICVDANNDLIFGEKRLHVYEMLDKKTIPAWRLSLQDLLLGKYHKKEIAHTFTINELVDLGIALEKLLKERRGRNNPENFPEYRGKDTRDIVANCLGYSCGKTYEQAKKVCQCGCHELIEATNQKLIAISSAALLAQLPFEQQKQILTFSKKEMIAVVKSIRNQETPNLSNVNSSMRNTP